MTGERRALGKKRARPEQNSVEAADPRHAWYLPGASAVFFVRFANKPR
jgi:hypothetical protein